MAVLLAKTMSQLNEERRNVYSLFQQPFKTTKPDEMPAPSVQHASNGTTEHSLSDNVVAQRGKESEKAVRDDHNPNPTSNILATLPQQSPLEPWREAGLGDHRRKRRKTASAEEGIAKKASVHPRAQRRRKASDSFHSSAASNELDLIQGRIAFGSDRKSEKVSENHGRIHGPTARRLIKDAPWLPEAHLKISEEQPSTTVVHGTTEEKSILKDHVLYNKPKKILHFNPKTGTIGSPPAKKLTASFAATNKPLSSSRSKHPKSKVVKIGYGQGEASSSAIGFQVDQVLNGVKRIEPPLKKKGSSSRMKGLSTPGAKDVPEIANPEIKSTLAATIAPRMPAAPIHPFFSEKPITKPTNAEETANANASTLDIETQKPVSLGRTQLASRSRPPEITKPRSSALTGFLGFGNSTKMVKFPGAIEPAWPWKGMVHVRGVEIVQRDDRVRIDAASDVRSRSKKSKYQATEILAKEDVLLTVTATLGVNQVVKSIRNMNLDDHPPLPVCLRIPKKHLESGRELQKRIREELHARLPRPKFVSDGESSGEDIRECGLGHTSTHPALSRAFASIAVSLTAFDQFRYETRPWTHKHAPRCAAEVLQPGKEAVILKEWLQKLIVISVETRASDPPETRASCTSKSSAASNPDPLEKRKRKSKKLAGFVVSSDEDDNDMDEISEAEDSASACGSQTPLKKTIIRQGDVAAKGAKDTKLMNAVVISGPHGCGKTATVYAVANELGFEVFEINSSSKRSGKDILERVGDMTRNHLVQRSHDKAPSASQDEDSQRIADAFEDDIKSGRQGTMDSFFKHKVRAKAKSKLKKLQPQTKTSNRVQVSLASKGQTNQQKQSLILFEEADILYEEDKQFWSTVIALIIQSKRPIIMTCQDESFLPMQTLSLHAILRFTPPSIDLATDYMLLVAANEGHALQRNAVKALYQGRHLDLRASITELNFWCQFAVGDVKGGLEWLCPRWPLGCDVDKHGKIIRVVSEKTYEAGMGWFSQDFLESHIHYLDIEEETLHEAKDGWNVDLGHWQESIDMTSWAEKIHDSSRSKVDNPAYLKMYDDFADAMSVADLLSGSAFGAENRVELDFTVPKLSEKAREDYVSNLPVLDATPLLDFDNTGGDISHWMKSRTRKYLQVDQHIKHGLEVPSELDRLSEVRIIKLIENQVLSPESTLRREDLSLAFDPISEPEKTYVWNTGQLEASVFDRTQAIITTDLAPYVRSIVSYDAKLQQERNRISNLLSEGGRKGKRMRTTRAAFSALEGGIRSTTRRDRYFTPDLNSYLVLKTGKPSWLEALTSSSASTADVSTRLSTCDTDPCNGESEIEAGG